MRKWIAILLTLLTSLSVTGLSFIDNLILDRIIAGLVAISFSLVGLLFKFGVIDGKREGQDAFRGVFVILLIGTLIIYLGIRKFQEWVMSWSLAVKIIVPSALGLLFIGAIVWAIHDYANNSDQYDDWVFKIGKGDYLWS